MRSLLLSFFLVAVVSSWAAESLQTNAPTRASRAQVWDMGQTLAFTAEQAKAMQEVRDSFEAAQRRFREGLAGQDVSPARKAELRLELRAALSNANERVEALLTDEQKQKFKKLRGSSRTRRGEPTSPVERSQPSPSPDPAEAEDRPLLSPAEYETLARELRSAYSKSPNKWPKAQIDDGVKFVELGLLPSVVHPTSNPFTTNKAELGKMLFFDPRLSGSGQIACASCHDAELGWGDGRAVAFGHGRKELKRNAPSLLNVGLGEHYFWDGRASSLEAQARAVLLNPDEMRSSEALIKARLGNIPAYLTAFEKAFGDRSITMERVTQAIATFERTIVSRRNPFDAFLRGNTDALSDSAIRGLHLFRTDARCANCHHGPNFTDGQFHNLGLSYYGRKLQDLGRYEETKRPEDVGAFKTPSLRNLPRTAPYMHNGLFDLRGVLNLYNAGMPTLRRKDSQKNDPLFPTKSKHLKPLGLNDQDLADLRAFLEALEESRARVRPPTLPGFEVAAGEPETEE